MGVVTEVDPWLWRRHRLLMSSPLAPPDEVTEPTEPVHGDASALLPEQLDALDAVAHARLNELAADVDSTALLVLRDGALVHEWYADGVERASLLPSQSMHKSLVGLVVLACVAEGTIPSLDTPVSTWITEWADDERAAITVDQLLQMSSGLAQTGFSMNPLSKSFQWLFSGDTTPHVLGLPAVRPAGGEFDYNNANSQVLGILLERATGARYASLLETFVWRDLGAAPATVWLDAPDGRAATSCCLGARAYDWALFGELIRTRAQPTLVDALCEPSPTSAQYARHIWLGDGMDAVGEGAGGLSPVGRTTATEPLAERGMIVACGFGGQRVYVARESGVVLVRMGPPSGTPRFYQRWDNTVLPNTAIRALT